jgi:23S rRNA-/tRNA-specific pseudouridylate synthase
LGDHLYASPKSRQVTSTYGSKRQFLHATRLTLSIPAKGEVTFEAPLAPDLIHVLDGLAAAQ